MIKINENYTKESLNIFLNSEILRFKTETVHFDSLGYQPIKEISVSLKNGFNYCITTKRTIRDLNKSVKNGLNTVNKLNGEC